jgi:hypothetical protein
LIKSDIESISVWEECNAIYNSPHVEKLFLQRS